MLLLATQAATQMRAHAHPCLGRPLTPRHHSSLPVTVADGVPWAADNDGFRGVDHAAWLRMLDRIQAALIDRADGDRRAERWAGAPLLVTVPDVVCDPAATAQRVRWAPAVRDRGLALAFVAQDGCQHGLIPALCEFDALFIGGSTKWKLGPVAAALVFAAKAAGKWVHIGRVNSLSRIRYCAAIGADSVDGSGWMRWRDRHLHSGLTAAAQGPQLHLVPASAGGS